MPIFSHVTEVDKNHHAVVDIAILIEQRAFHVAKDASKVLTAADQLGWNLVELLDCVAQLAILTDQARPARPLHQLTLFLRTRLRVLEVVPDVGEFGL